MGKILISFFSENIKFKLRVRWNIIRGKQNYEAEENTLNTLIDFFTRQCQQMKNTN